MMRKIQYNTYGSDREGGSRFRARPERPYTPEGRGFTDRSRSRDGDISRRASDFMHFEPPTRVGDGEISTRPEPLMSVRLDQDRDAQTSRRPDGRRGNDIPPLFDSGYSLQETNRSDHVSDESSVRWTYPDNAYTQGLSTSGSYLSNLEAENLKLRAFAVPDFCPGLSEQNSYEWMEVLEATAAKHQWNDTTKASILRIRIRGRAEQWLSAVGVNCRSWIELKEAFLKAFAFHENFPSRLHKMLKRVKQEDEPLATYFFKKVELLEECKISGANAVSCIIDGLENRSMQELAVEKRFDDSDELYRYLVQVFPEPPVSTKTQNSRK